MCPKGSNFKYESLPPSVQQVVYSSHPHVGFKHLIIHHVEWHGVGLAITKITLAMFKTFYNDLSIMHWIPKVVFMPSFPRSCKPHTLWGQSR